MHYNCSHVYVLPYENPFFAQYDILICHFYKIKLLIGYVGTFYVFIHHSLQFNSIIVPIVWQSSYHIFFYT